MMSMGLKRTTADVPCVGGACRPAVLARTPGQAQLSSDTKHGRK